MGQTQSVPGQGGDPEALGLLLERALQGDGQALEVLVTLLRTRHYKRILTNLHHSRTKSSTQTLEDVFQDSIVQLVEKVRSGELRDLAEKDRRDVLGYFFRVCDRRVADLRRPRMSPVTARDKVEIPSDIVDPQAVAPGEYPTAERHRRLLDSAILRLPETDREVLQQFLAGVPQRTIAEQTGRSEERVAFILKRARERLLLDIAPRSPTAQLKYEEERQDALREPTPEEVRAAVEVLPPELKQAVVLLHFEGKTIEDLTRRLGPKSEKKAFARIKQAYRILSAKLNCEFPKSFELLSK